MASAYDLRVLLVEDIPGLRRVYERLLQTCGFSSADLRKRLGALALLEEEAFDVVVSDIGMPLMDGFDLARSIRKNPAYDKIRLVALTAYSLPSLVNQGRATGFKAYLAKPVDISDLCAAVLGRHVSTDFFGRPQFEHGHSY